MTGGTDPSGRRVRIRMRERPTDEPHRASTALELLFDRTFVVAVAGITAQLAPRLRGRPCPGGTDTVPAGVVRDLVSVAEPHVVRLVLRHRTRRPARRPGPEPTDATIDPAPTPGARPATSSASRSVPRPPTGGRRPTGGRAVRPRPSLSRRSVGRVAARTARRASGRDIRRPDRGDRARHVAAATVAGIAEEGLWLDGAHARPALDVPPRGTSGVAATATTSSLCSRAPSVRSRRQFVAAP
jgi:hypothetical protein